MLSQGGGPAPGSETGAVDALDQAELASRLPHPDFFVNAYSGCSTGQQWDEMSYRVFGKNVPIFNVSIPFLWGNHADSGYMQGQEWEEATDYVVAQLGELIAFIEGQTGRPFDWDALSESMSYIKRASELRLEGMELCANKPTPATYWDWIASIAHINFLPGNQDLVNYFGSVRDEIAARVANGVPALENERYRLYFDGIMNWNKLGWLAKRFAEYDAAVIAGRYTHSSFWQEPQIIDAENPLRGMAQHYLICPINHSLKTLNYLTLRDCERFDIDGMVFHSTRTCRAFTNPQTLLARSAREHLGLPAMFSRATSPMPRSTRTKSSRAGWWPCSRTSTSGAPKGRWSSGMTVHTMGVDQGLRRARLSSSMSPARSWPTKSSKWGREPTWVTAAIAAVLEEANLGMRNSTGWSQPGTAVGWCRTWTGRSPR